MDPTITPTRRLITPRRSASWASSPAPTSSATARGFDTPDAIDILHDQRVGGNGFLKLDDELDGSNRIALLATFSQDHFQIPIDPTMLPLSDAPPSAVRGGDIYGNPPPQFVPYDANPTDDERNLFTALSYVHSGPVRGQVSAYLREGYSNLDCDPTGSLGVTADPGSTCSSITRDSFHAGATASLAWRWLEGHAWKAGVSLDNQQSKVVATTFTRDDNSPTGGADPSATLLGGDHVNTLSVGAYLEDEIKIDKLTLQPGVRFDAQNTTFGSSNEPSLFLSGPSARLGASYADQRRAAPARVRGLSLGGAGELRRAGRGAGADPLARRTVAAGRFQGRHHLEL